MNYTLQQNSSTQPISVSSFLFRLATVCILMLVAAGISPKNSIAQGSNSAQTSSEFQKRVAAMLATKSNGEYLYEHSESFHDWIERRVSNDMGLTPEANMLRENAEQAEGVNGPMDVSKEAGTNEPTIAISRTNPNIVVVGANGNVLPSYYTSDAGQHWSTFHFPQTVAGGFFPFCDPELAADDKGNIYYAFLAPDPGNNIDLVVGITQDGKKWTYSAPVYPKAQAPLHSMDREGITIDNSPTSPHYGRIYVNYMEWVTSITGLYLAWSDDQGKTWSTPVQVTQQWSRVTQVRTGKNGEIVIANSEVDPSQGQPSWIDVVEVSTDGGTTFTETQFASIQDYPTNGYGRDGLKGSAGFRTFAYIGMNVEYMDPKSRIQVVYSSYNTDTNTQAQYAGLFATYSDDLGATWSPAVEVHSVPRTATTNPCDNYQPWVAYDAAKQVSYVSYYSSEADPQNALTQVVRNTLPYLGTQSEQQLLVEDSLFNHLDCSGGGGGGSVFIGDYEFCDATNGTFAAAWCESPDGFQANIFGYISSGAAGVTKTAVNGTDVWLSNPSENPVHDASTQVSFRTAQSGAISLALYDERGVLVRKFVNEQLSPGTYNRTLDLSSLASGSYILRLDGQQTTAETKLVVAK